MVTEDAFPALSDACSCGSWSRQGAETTRDRDWFASWCPRCVLNDCAFLRGSRNRRGLRPPDLGEDRALRRLQPARREGRVVGLRYPARCLPNRGAMAPALLFRSTGLDLLRHLKVSVLARLD